jgi:hypothetical protein
MLANLDGLVWLLLLLFPLFFLQKSLHREIQVVLLLITRRSDITLFIFSLFFLPGVFLHECSHFLMALLLRVRTGKFSMVPQPLDNGRLRMGYVETVKTDVIRDSLIGAAPLLSGGLFIIYAGITRLHLDVLWLELIDGGPGKLFASLDTVMNMPDFWLWFYLIFTVSSTMMPSSADRRAWLPIAVVVLVIFTLVLTAGLGPWMLEHLAPVVNSSLRAVAAVFGISMAVHLVLLLPLLGFRQLLEKLTGYRAV